MPVPDHYDNLTLDRRCVAAYFHGTLPALLQEVHYARCTEITLSDLTSRAEVYTEAWRIGDPDKTECYLCEGPVEGGRLCVCFDDVRPRRLVNVNDARILSKLDPEMPVETFVCHDCGCLATTIAKEALAQHKRGKGYQTRKYCSPCHKTSHCGPKAHQHSPRAPKVLKPSLVQQAAESVVSGQA